MSRARFVAAACQEFFTEVAYYNKMQTGLGARFASAVEKAVARALAFPLAGSPSVSNTRRIFVKGFPFTIIYRPENSDIIVFAVSHQSRSPAYWIDRIPL